MPIGGLCGEPISIRALKSGFNKKERFCPRKSRAWQSYNMLAVEDPSASSVSVMAFC